MWAVKAMQWDPIFALPNLKLEDAVEGEYAALVPADDSRLKTAAEAQPNIGVFLSHFTDAFGVKVRPMMLMLRTNAPPLFRDLGALLAFRDLVAISVLSYNRAVELRSPMGHRIVYGDSFACYPWMVSTDGKHLVASSPAFIGLHDVSKFRGQSSPSMSRTLGDRVWDRPLVDALVARWQRRYSTNEPLWNDVALFRSLNMAYHASLIPTVTSATHYDVGRMISLWVSAFEILVHPGGNQQANRDKVFELLDGVPWKRNDASARQHETGGKTKTKRTLASFLYQQLNDRRNDYLHGNPVEVEQLLVQPRRRLLLDYAAPLYRAALTGFLLLRPSDPSGMGHDVKAMADHIASLTEFYGPQRTMEDGLLTALQPPDNEDDDE